MLLKETGYCDLSHAQNCQYSVDIVNVSNSMYGLDYYNNQRCCHYLMGTDANTLSQQELSDKVKSVRDLNIASYVVIIYL